VKASVLFFGALFLSIAVHGLILFTPQRSITGSVPRAESYRVELIQKPTQTVEKKEPEAKPEPPGDAEKPELPETIEKEQTADSQLPQERRQITDHEREVLGTINTYWTNTRSSRVPANSGSSNRSEYHRILDELDRMLRETLRYPEVARRKGIEGAVAVKLTLNTNGEASNLVVAESSGSRLLDRAAVQAISAIFPYPDPPGAPLHFTIPVTYRLTE
jgi:protein TonB